MMKLLYNVQYNNILLLNTSFIPLFMLILWIEMRSYKLTRIIIGYFLNTE